VEALQDGILAGPTETSNYHAQLAAETDRLGALVNDLLELNRISAGAIELELEPVMLGDIVSDMVSSFAVVADARGITLHAPPANGNTAAKVSPPHLERALGNLLDNALRYTCVGGIVEVSIETHRTEVCVLIDDSCGNADLDQLKKLVSGPSPSELIGRSGRTGLGVAIARGLVEAQAGRLGVEATPNGCRFTVALPLIHPQRTTEAVPRVTAVS
jgi:signal transduction histidine kinase